MGPGVLVNIRMLGHSSVPVSRIGMGGAPLGNLFHAVDQEAALETVRIAWEKGERLFDTAPHYGLGLSERRLGQALAELPCGEFTQCTKVGRILEPGPSHGRVDQGFNVPATHSRSCATRACGHHARLSPTLEH